MSRLIIGIIIILLPFHANAKWGDFASAPSETVFFNWDIKVNEDGTSDEIVEFQDKIINEKGRYDAANFVKVYNANDTEIKILEAYTIYNGEKYNVDPEAIEDKPLASAEKGFDQSRQILISFPKVEVGSQIYLKYSKKIIMNILPKYYGNTFSFAEGDCWREANINITSSLPLYTEINDPEKVLEVLDGKKDDIHSLKIKLKQAICRTIDPGTEVGEINDRKYTWLAVSSLKSWEQFAREFAVDYDAVINQPLPELLIPILEAARKEQDEINQLNIVTSLINDKISYMGAWGSIKGQFIPRDLKITAETQKGDCKDFTAATAAILKSLGGYEVYPALVFRGEGVIPGESEIPRWFFNHVMLKVINKSGKIYWIDPTNFTSMAQGMRADINDRIALVLDQKSPSYEKIPKIDPNHAQTFFSREVIIDGDVVKSDGYVIFKGESAQGITGATLLMSESILKNDIFIQLSGAYLKEDQKKEIIIPDLSSRIVKDVTINFKYEQNDLLVKTNLGSAIKLSASWADWFSDNVKGQLSDIYIGSPISKEIQLIVKNLKVKNIENLNYEYDSPWLYVKRLCTYRQGDTHVNDYITIKKNFITSEELDSEEYKALKESLEKNISNVVIVLDNI
jgi:hypothetical protein